MICNFHKDHLEKPIATSPLKNFAPLIAKSITKLTPKPLKAHIKKKREKCLKSSFKQIIEA